MLKNPFRKRHFDVLTIGAATRDVFILSQRFKNIRDPLAPDALDACFPLGAKIDLDEVIFETGGGATNAAVTFSRFGLKTACVARVGADIGGQEIIQRLEKDKIDVTQIQRDPKNRTGYSLILVAGSGHRAILVFRGASRLLAEREIDFKKLAPRWIYLTSLGGDVNALKYIFAQAKKYDIRIGWNPGNAELELGLKKLTPWLLQTDILSLNRHEAAALTDYPPRDLESIIHRLGIFPRQALVITDGQHGAYAHSRDITWYAPVIPAKRINTTGAGDAFGSAFVATAIKTGNLEKALRVATLNATGVITHMGAKAGILKKFPTITEMRKAKLKKL